MTGGAEALLLALLIAAGPVEGASNDTCTKAITYLEARGEGVRGIAGVRQVIRNRARKSGETTCKVVKRRGQFSSYRHGMNLTKVKTDKMFLTAWKKSVKIQPLTGEYTHFYRKGSTPKWARELECDRVIKNHVFCKA